MFPIQQVFLLKNEKGAVETTAPPGDSGGIQTHDLQNFFSTKSFCSKIKKVQLRQLHPLVIPVGFKPTTFRTFSRPSLSASKRKRCS